MKAKSYSVMAEGYSTISVNAYSQAQARAYARKAWGVERLPKGTSVVWFW